MRALLTCCIVVAALACSLREATPLGEPCYTVGPSSIYCPESVDSCYVTWEAPKKCEEGWWYAMVGVAHYRVPWTSRKFTLGYTTGELSYLLKESM